MWNKKLIGVMASGFLTVAGLASSAQASYYSYPFMTGYPYQNYYPTNSTTYPVDYNSYYADSVYNYPNSYYQTPSNGCTTAQCLYDNACANGQCVSNMLGGSPDYLTYGQGYMSLFRPNNIVLVINNSVVGITFPNANPSPRINAYDGLPNYNNQYQYPYPMDSYYNTPAYKNVDYSSLYPGVDLNYRGNRNDQLYGFTFNPGADLNQFAMQMNGHQSINLDNGGNLVIVVNGSSITLPRPTAYQNYYGYHYPIDGSYQLYDNQRVGFSFDGYNKNRPLHVKPIRLNQ